MGIESMSRLCSDFLGHPVDIGQGVEHGFPKLQSGKCSGMGVFQLNKRMTLISTDRHGNDWVRHAKLALLKKSANAHSLSAIALQIGE
jgi:hypothetical protein